MRYTVSIDLKLPRQKVIKLLDNTDNLKLWQPGLYKIEHLNGSRGTPGAKMKLYYKMGKREVEMIETIITREFPEKFHSSYDADGVQNIQKNYFEEIDQNTTRWTSVCEFRFSNFSMRIMGWLIPSAFKKQSLEYMEHFKKFAEAMV